MNKKSIITTIALILIALPVLSMLTPHVAYASWLDSSFYSFIGWIAEGIFVVAGWFISLTGVLLNGVMVATLNMKIIVDGTTAIGVAWRTIRDFSSIFIIFMLLYASISMILGVKGPGLGNLIKNVIIAGLLINFSLFGTKLIIDASNIISASFYCAMAPNSNGCNGTSNTTITSAFTDSGISNIFMQSLDIQAVGVPNSANLKDSNPELSIALSYIGGSVLMFVAGMSFLTAAIMFAIRIGVLILLMAFSPIYFIAMMLPGTDIEKYAKKWSGMLYGMCVFMPVYLFLMYIAVSVINDPLFFSFLVPPAGTQVGLMSAHTVGIVLQYIIAFIMINAPLAAAVSIAGESADFVNEMTKSVKKWGQGYIGAVGQHTIGRAAKSAVDSEMFGNLAREHPGLATIASGALTKVSGATYGGTKGGYDERFKKYSKSLQDVSKKARATDKHEEQFNIERGRLETQLENAEDANEKSKLRDKIEKMNEDKKEIMKGYARKEAADNMEKGWLNKILITTKAARKDAVKKIREDEKKGKGKKILDLLKDLEKEEGGGKPKDADAKDKK